MDDTETSVTLISTDYKLGEQKSNCEPFSTLKVYSSRGPPWVCLLSAERRNLDMHVDCLPRTTITRIETHSTGGRMTLNFSRILVQAKFFLRNCRVITGLRELTGTEHLSTKPSWPEPNTEIPPLLVSNNMQTKRSLGTFLF